MEQLNLYFDALRGLINGVFVFSYYLYYGCSNNRLQHCVL